MQAEKVLLWDRKTEGGFPETKVLKQRVRDRIDPKKDLGHSDVGGKKAAAVKSGEENNKEDEKTEGMVEKIAKEAVVDSKLEDAQEVTVEKKPNSLVCEDCQ